MRCGKCSAELVGTKRFCMACGAAVGAAAIDPFASTVKPTAPIAPASSPELVAPSAPAPSRRAVSPLASSGLEFSEDVRELIASRGEPPSSEASGSERRPRQATAVLHRPSSGAMPAAAAAPLSAPAISQPAQVPRSGQPAPPAPVAAAQPFVMTPPAPAPPPPPLTPGSAVRVRWSNGQLYPGTVWQVHGGHALVAFPDGQRHWVELTYLAR